MGCNMSSSSASSQKKKEVGVVANIVVPSKPNFPKGPLDVEGGAYAYNWIPLWLGSTETVIEFQEKGWCLVTEKEGWNGFGVGWFAKLKDAPVRTLPTGLMVGSI